MKLARSTHHQERGVDPDEKPDPVIRNAERILFAQGEDVDQ
jgi:hypothetical protein